MKARLRTVRKTAPGQRPSFGLDVPVERSDSFWLGMGGLWGGGGGGRQFMKNRIVFVRVMFFDIRWGEVCPLFPAMSQSLVP